MDIHHDLSGSRQVSVMRGDRHIVAERGRPGYVERRYEFHGHEYWHRSYYYHGHSYDYFYRGFSFHGVGLHVYLPVHYYNAGFYGWAYHPWRTRVVYAWGWGGSPWVGYYGPYFAPYPSYAGAPYWLTDYMLSSDLQAAYQAGLADGTLAQSQPVAGGPALTPEVKDQIAREVQAQIALEQAEQQQNANGQEADPASSGIARMLGDGAPHVFVVGTALDVEDQESGDDCALTEGDALELLPPGTGEKAETTAPPETTASLVVLASKGGKECAKSATVTVNLDDLQEMQNHMRETVDRGLEELRKMQGTSGIPALPQAATAEPATPAFAPIAPPPDPNDAAEIEQQQTEADKSEQETLSEEKHEDAGSKPAQTPPATTH